MAPSYSSKTSFLERLLNDEATQEKLAYEICERRREKKALRMSGLTKEGWKETVRCHLFENMI